MASGDPTGNRQGKQVLIRHSSLERGISRRNSHCCCLGRVEMCWSVGDLGQLPVWQQH